MKKIVYVTGCLGFIGYHVTKRCLDEGFYVYGVDKQTYACNPQFLPDLLQNPQFKYSDCDINDIERPKVNSISSSMIYIIYFI